MMECEEFAAACQEHGFDFFTGVPDSTYTSWMTYLGRDDTELTNVTAVNECEATAIGTGYHLATNNVGVIYMQNDGLGKCVNPLTSLTNKGVYNIPLLLMIGWRSEPGVDDAIQHDKMGEILIDLLELLDVPHRILPKEIEGANAVLEDAKDHFMTKGTPYAIIVRHDTFEPDTRQNTGGPGRMSREDAIAVVMNELKGEELVLSTTGKLSRELYEYRKRAGDEPGSDFYNVGAMGCVQSIGLGVTLGRPDRDVLVFDGDGSVLMQMGALATIGYYSPENFHHVVFDNEAHDSTGGQATSSATMAFDRVAAACGYEETSVVSTEAGLADTIVDHLAAAGPTLTVIKIKRGARPDLGRPDEPLTELKQHFMNAIHTTDTIR